MAPIEVIDLTSSPEPDDTAARVAALSRFQPRKQKSQVRHGLPTIPVNGLPFSYANREERVDNDNVRRGFQAASGLPQGARVGADSIPVGSGAAISLREGSKGTWTEIGAATSISQPLDPQSSVQSQTHAFDNGTSNQAAAPSRNFLSQKKGKKSEICANCSKAFTRREKMHSHRQRCEARSRGRMATQPTAASPQAPIPLLAGADHDVPFVKENFNLLKRSIPSPDRSYRRRPNETVKRARVDLSCPEPQQQPRPTMLLVDVTDATMESFVYSDESNNPPPESKRPKVQLVDGGFPYTAVPQHPDNLSSGPSRNGLPYSAEEDALLTQLREVDRLPFHSIVGRFSGRTEGSLTVRCHTLRKRNAIPASREPARSVRVAFRSDAPAKRIRKNTMADGMVPWAAVKKARVGEPQAVEVQRKTKRLKVLKETKAGASLSERSESGAEDDTTKSSSKDSTYPSSMARILRLREMGTCGRRAWTNNLHGVPDELKDHVFSDFGLQRDYQGTSGDVISLAWNDNSRFAASSIAITDQQSMQYNMHRNLLVGDTSRGDVHELLEHHISRPVVESITNINANHAMRESQDSRLFLSVVAAKFCPEDSTRLFTAGMDNTLRHFNVKSNDVKHRYAIEHTAPVTLLSIGAGHGFVATGCHQSTRNINVFQCDTQKYEVKLQLCSRQATVPVFPSALKWGYAHQHRNLLLAGFSGEEDVASAATGETCLWDIATGQQLFLGGVTRNVFDVAWNPIPSSSSIAFAIAGNANGHIVEKGMRSVVQCFAAGQKGGRGVLDWQCPALDLNDLVFCPHDDNLIAAGATNGCVYIWDKRSADRSQRPLHTLEHGESLNVLDHDRDAETADTGVQFLAWGPTKNRLYSGSSDGIVKMWNPYRSPHNAHVGDISGPSRDRSAIMSGAFSPDFQELLVGTENGRINLFKSGSGTVSPIPRHFTLIPGPEPGKERQEPFIDARSLVESGQIELRPCGAMPFRQAVQGPNYQGPFLEPSEAQRREAIKRLDRAILSQARQGDGYVEADTIQAAKELEIAEQVVTDLQRRTELAWTVIPKAEAFQRELAESERSRRELETLAGDVERCKLGCAVLQQRDSDEDGEVEDSGLSELRIPGWWRYADGATSRVERNASVPKRPGCHLPDPHTGEEMHDYTTECVLKRARLTSACTSCGRPTRPEMQEGKAPICERCAFGCFRCGMSMVVSEDSSLISCGSCGLEWETGILGYEVVQPSSSSSLTEVGTDAIKNGEEGDLMELGDREREFYARRWGAQ